MKPIVRVASTAFVLASLAPLAVTTAARVAPQKEACEELKKMLDRLGHRTDTGRGWSFSGGEIDEVRTHQKVAQVDLQIIEELQKRFTADGPVKRQDAKEAADAVTGRLKADLDKKDQGLPEPLRAVLGPSGREQVDMKKELGIDAINLRLEIKRLGDEENDKARVINGLTDQYAGLDCDNVLAGKPAAKPAAKAAGSSGSSGSGDSGSSSGKGSGVEAWEATWTHPFGTMDISANLDIAGIRSELETANAYGPALTCIDGGAVFMGTIEWKGGAFDARAWTGRVWACSTGDDKNPVLVGKFSNRPMMTAATAALGVRGGSFKLEKVDGLNWQGTYQTWNGTTSGAPIKWKGAK